MSKEKEVKDTEEKEGGSTVNERTSESGANKSTGYADDGDYEWEDRLASKYEVACESLGSAVGSVMDAVFALHGAGAMTNDGKCQKASVKLMKIVNELQKVHKKCFGEFNGAIYNTASYQAWHESRWNVEVGCGGCEYPDCECEGDCDKCDGHPGGCKNCEMSTNNADCDDRGQRDEAT